MFITLFTYWSGADYACMAGAVLLSYAVLSVVCKLFQKKAWPWQQPGALQRMLLPSLIMVAPLLLQIHSYKAAALADGEAGRALLRAHYINHHSNEKLLLFFESLCSQYRQREEFLQNAIPAYAQHIFNSSKERFLPVKNWSATELTSGNRECTVALNNVWTYRGSADLLSNRKHLYSVLNTATRDYLVAEQQQQNLQALQEGYSAPLWFVLTSLFAFYLAATWAMPKGESDCTDINPVQ